MKILRIFLIALGFFGAEKLCRKATDGFAIEKMASLPEGKPSFALLDRSILGQRFTYLDKGGQCYVFASEDGNYVLKFFRKSKTLEKTYQSVKIAEELLSEETGLLYAHLNPAELPPLQIVDKLHIAHTIDPNKHSWILQRKAKAVRPYLAHLMDQGKVVEAKRALSELLALSEKIGAKGISDADANLVKNFGFYNDQPIEIDVGRFDHRKTESKKLEQSKEDLFNWLNAHYPALLEP